jgi:hypothetical protein
MRMSIVLTIVGVFAVSGCGSDEEDELPEVDCSGTIPTYAQLKTGALTKCLPCHTSTVTGAAHLGEIGVDYDMFALAKANAEKGAEEINEGAMPQQPYTMSDAEKQEFYKWALCGTPE